MGIDMPSDVKMVASIQALAALEGIRRELLALGYESNIWALATLSIEMDIRYEANLLGVVLPDVLIAAEGGLCFLHGENPQGGCNVCGAESIEAVSQNSAKSAKEKD